MQTETTDPQRMEQLLRDALRQISSDGDLSRYIHWARDRIPVVLGVESDLVEDEALRLGTMLGVAIWNATPRAETGWQPIAPPLPADDAPCFCGSGLDYADCCEALGPLPELPAELIWDLLLDELSDEAIQDALRRRAVPETLFAKIAERWLDQDRPGRVASLLEPLFRGDLGGLDERYEPALDLLCDAFDLLDHWKKKQAFLLRLTDQGSRPLQAAAWQRFTMMFMDQGELNHAHEAFEQALRHGPDQPSTALLEITLLAARKEDVRARSRAEFWHHRLRRIGAAEPGMLAFLEQAIADPQAAMIASHAEVMDPILLGLCQWLRDLPSQPLAGYSVQPLADGPAGLDPSERQLSLFPVPSAPPSSERPAAGALLAKRSLRRIEREWLQVFPIAKPVGTELMAPAAEGVWEREDWLGFLLARPEAANSLSILDDLATALDAHPESGLPWVAQGLLEPLYARAVAIIDAISAPRDGCMSLPWSIEHNRPALRLLVRAHLLEVGAGHEEAAAALVERLLALNPQDTHGVRAELMNHYLRLHSDQQALELARRFPNDALADLAYGEVLALYRLGQPERAARALRSAVDRLPGIPRFLLRKRVRRPTLHQDGFEVADEDQAWRYRQAMRDVWAAEPGLLNWMKKRLSA